MFNQVVFGGGGGRCCWQVGFWQAIEDEINLAPQVVSAVSAGALMASLVLMGRGQEAEDYFLSVTQQNQRNVYWSNLLRKPPVFPHYEIYRRGVRELFDGGFDKLCAATDLRVAVTLRPRWMPPVCALAAGGTLYYINKYLLRSLHPKLPSRLGFRQVFYRVRDCANEAELEHLILSSSCTPPITPRLRMDGAQVLDGGVVDNAPIDGLEAYKGLVLILPTRRYPRLPHWFSRRVQGQTWVYVQPSRRLPIKSWDFTNPEALTETFEIGRVDGRAFLAEIVAKGGRFGFGN
ncbi:patatin-like phospholipase family protein [Microbulbifer sp. SSSA007]|uniref:patatin-like phospholipase family protein n=1 Tax=Microbulbifer sp. SSSA007 TaxID=3243379 RepID=UPI00403955F9